MPGDDPAFGSAMPPTLRITWLSFFKASRVRSGIKLAVFFTLS